MLDEDSNTDPNENQTKGNETSASHVSEPDESVSEFPEVNSNNSELQPDSDSGDNHSNSDESDSSSDVANSTENEQKLEGESADSEEARTPEEEIAHLNEQNLRLVADMENLRRRTENEKRDAHQFAVASFAKELLDVSDNLMRALQTIPEESRENADNNLKSLLEGVEMTERVLQKVLLNHRVIKIDPTGEKFDPHFHQAMFEVTDSDAPNNTVVQVVQPGYKIGERMLRPAMVGVAKTTENKNGE